MHTHYTSAIGFASPGKISSFPNQREIAGCKRHLTQMIYCVIGRSDDPSVSMLGGDWLIRGPWAGDRIDITLVSIHEQEHGNEKEQWKDITDGVMQKLREVSDEEDREDEFSD
ncbi:hypothetical protein EV360DRAFT_90740 [Lentinula raphanica]|nr:hypothetical protein EV360DRAFT_90740 [Lentinula raphanica]